MKLGCIADDLTGATDLALMLAREGMRDCADDWGPKQPILTYQAQTWWSSPSNREPLPSRMPSRNPWRRRRLCARRAQSTSSSSTAPPSTPRMKAISGRWPRRFWTFTGSSFTLACPAFPANGRTVYKGHLFVNGVPLHESSMKDHPLTPMRDPNLVRVLQRQTKLSVGLVAFEDVEAGPDAIRRLPSSGRRRQGIRS